MRKLAVVLCFILLPATLAANEPLHPAAEIAAAEIAFARDSVTAGLNTAFATHFADHAVDFAPLPRANARRFYQGQPNPPVVLDWYPAYTLAAASGDFGLSIGPFEIRDPEGLRPPRHGHYISMWERQASGEWKVVIDGGVSHPPPAVPPARLNPANMPVNPLSAPAEWRDTTVEALLEVDAAFSRRAERDGIVAAFEDVAVANLRFYRDGLLPVTDRAAALDFLRQLPGDWRWQPQGGGIASSGDLGFTYGVSSRTVNEKIERGAYLRVWQRTAAGWQLMLNRDNPVPENPRD